MAQPFFQMWVRDAALNRIQIVRDFINADFTLRFNDIGRWVLDVPADGLAAKAMRLPGAGIMLVDRAGNVVFSGPVDAPEDDWSANSVAGVYRGSGPDDLGRLQWRLALPTPQRVVQNSYYGQVLYGLPCNYYRLNETTGTITVDVSGFKTNGTYVGGVSLAAGGSIPVDIFPTPYFPADAYMTHALPNMGTGASGTVEFWFFPTWGGGDSISHGLWQNRDDTTFDPLGGITLFKYVDNNWYFRIISPAGVNQDAAVPAGSGPGYLSANAWHHVVATWAPTGMALYLDGALIASRNGLIPPSAPVIGPGTPPLARLGYGYGSGTAAYFDDLAIYDHAIPAADVFNHYQAGLVASSLYHTVIGPAETALHTYIDQNAGPGATAARQIPNLTLWTDAAQGVVLRIDARYQTVLDVCKQIGLADGHIGFKMTQSGTSTTLLATGYMPIDRSASVIYSASRHNLAAFNRKRVGPLSTHIYAGGAGVGVDRLILEADDPAAASAWGGRREAFQDASVRPLSTLTQAVTEIMRSQIARDEVMAEPVWLDSLQFGRDYAIGDLISVMSHGEQIIGCVRSAQIIGSADGPWRVRPTIGPAGITEAQRTAVLRSYAQRLTALEQNPNIVH